MSRHDSISPTSETAHHKHESPVVGGLYLDEAGEHPPDYGKPLSYDEQRWGGPHRDTTSGGIPTMSASRVLALRILNVQERSADGVIAAIVSDLSLDDEVVAQRTQTGENRLAIRVRWALATLLRMGFVEITDANPQKSGRKQASRPPQVPSRTDASEIYRVTGKGVSMLAKDPVRIDESGTGSIRKERPKKHLGH